MGQRNNVATTVDVSINELVLNAAHTRIDLIARQEREANGRSNLSMSTLAEQILTQWEPGQTKPLPPLPQGTAKCPTCGREVKLYHNGKLRAHRRRVQKDGAEVSIACPEAFATKAAERAAQVKPLRFAMNRAKYKAIAQEIHAHGQSVAGVITQRLRQFAKEGHL